MQLERSAIEIEAKDKMGKKSRGGGGESAGISAVEVCDWRRRWYGVRGKRIVQ